MWHVTANMWHVIVTFEFVVSMCTYVQVTSDEALAMLLQAETATSKPSPKLRIPAKTTTRGGAVSPIPPWRKNGTQIQIPCVDNMVTTDEALSILIHSESVSPSRASTPSRDALPTPANMTPSTLSRFQKVAMKSKVSVGLTAHSKREQDTETTIGKSVSCTLLSCLLLYLLTCTSTYLLKVQDTLCCKTPFVARHPWLLYLLTCTCMPRTCCIYSLAPACLHIQLRAFLLTCLYESTDG